HAVAHGGIDHDLVTAACRKRTEDDRHIGAVTDGYGSSADEAVWALDGVARARQGRAGSSVQPLSGRATIIVISRRFGAAPKACQQRRQENPCVVRHHATPSASRIPSVPCRD